MTSRNARLALAAVASTAGFLLVGSPAQAATTAPAPAPAATAPAAPTAPATPTPPVAPVAPGTPTPIPANSRALFFKAPSKAELKKILESCVGFGIGGGSVARLLTNPKTLFKFLIRRIGVAAVLSCAGGVAWRYI